MIKMYNEKIKNQTKRNIEEFVITGNKNKNDKYLRRMN